MTPRLTLRCTTITPDAPCGVPRILLSSPTNWTRTNRMNRTGRLGKNLRRKKINKTTHTINRQAEFTRVNSEKERERIIVTTKNIREREKQTQQKRDEMFGISQMKDGRCGDSTLRRLACVIRLSWVPFPCYICFSVPS